MFALRMNKKFLRGGRKTPNPWESITQEYDKYGKYAYLFDPNIDSSKFYDDSAIQHFGLLNYPFFGLNSWVAPCAIVSGNVELWQFSTIWYNVTIRADTKLVRIGAYATIEENCIITEATQPLPDEPDHDGSTIVGHYVKVGHASVLEACTIEPYCVVGAKCTLLPGSYMEEYSQLLPGSVLEGRVPSGEVWGGNPARFVKQVTALEKYEAYKYSSQVNLAEVHKNEFYLPPVTFAEKLEQEGHVVSWLKPGFGINMDE